VNIKWKIVKSNYDINEINLVILWENEKIEILIIVKDEISQDIKINNEYLKCMIKMIFKMQYVFIEKKLVIFDVKNLKLKVLFQ